MHTAHREEKQWVGWGEYLAWRGPQADLVSLKSRQARLRKGGPGLMPKVFLDDEGSDKVGEI